MMLDICGYVAEDCLFLMTLTDPSCGDGVFVTEAVERLCLSARKHDIRLESLAGCIRAYDTDEDAITVARQMTARILSTHGADRAIAGKLLDEWFRCEDFILADGDESDIVIGNPPYIRSSDIPVDVRKSYAEVLEGFSMGTDMYIAFLEKGMRTIRKSGVLCLICPDRWQKNMSGAGLRSFMQENGMQISINCQMHGVDAFDKAVSAYPSVTVISHGNDARTDVICSPSFDEPDADSLVSSLKTGDRTSTPAYRFRSGSREYGPMPTLEEAGVTVGIGIATGKDSVFITDDACIVEEDRLVPLAYARDISDFRLPESPARWLINPWKDGSLVDLDEYPRLKAYFLLHEDELKGRYIARKNSKRWYGTIDKMRPGLAGREKLLIRDISSRPEPVYDDGIYYPHHNLYWMTSDDWDMEVLGGILISDTVNGMMQESSVRMRGGAIRNQAQYLRRIRIPPYQSIGTDDRMELKSAFVAHDRKKATEICERLYGRWKEM